MERPKQLSRYGALGVIASAFAFAPIAAAPVSHREVPHRSLGNRRSTAFYPNGRRECERRRRQVEFGTLTVANGLAT